MTLRAFHLTLSPPSFSYTSPSPFCTLYCAFVLWQRREGQKFNTPALRDSIRITAGRPFLRGGNPIPARISCGNLDSLSYSGSPCFALLFRQPWLPLLTLAALAPPAYSGSSVCPLSFCQALLPSLSLTLATLALFSLALTFQCPPRVWPQVQPLLEELLNLWSAGRGQEEERVG